MKVTGIPENTHKAEMLAEVIVDFRMSFPETSFNILVHAVGEVLEDDILASEPVSMTSYLAYLRRT